MEILRIENLTFRYPKSEQNALESVDLSVKRGQFVLLCGQSGCGKTTLLRLIKRELAPAGECSGRILYDGIEQDKLDGRKSASEIGFVMQNPDSQIVTDKVWHELAFGPESLGLPTDVIRRRVGEMASYFGITDWFRKKTDELSGGQKQMLNLAAVLVMQPKILILDEPTGQLDPIAASGFFATLQKINRELGLTILLCEHRLEEVFPIADRVVLMDGGKIRLDGHPSKIGADLSNLHADHPMLDGLPSAVRIFRALGGVGDCPLSVREGRDFLESRYPPSSSDVASAVRTPSPSDKEPAIEMREVWFRYQKDSPDVLRGATLDVRKGEIFCILGANGSGKTTLLNGIAGLIRPYRGKIRIGGKPIREYHGNLYRSNLALLPQNPQTVFMRDTVAGDFAEILAAVGVSKEERQEKIREIAQQLAIFPLLDRHPYDLSGGEQQKCALGKVLLTSPKILLLDEPTKGLDAHFKSELIGILRELCRQGLTVLTVTHDVEFAAECADRCALFFDGEILSADVPERFFSSNSFYTTAANRIARGIWPDAVTCGQVIGYCADRDKGGLQ